MSSERAWHLIRFGAGLGATTLAFILYAALSAEHAQRVAGTATANIRAVLSTCATALAQGPDNLAALGSCSQALPGMREDILRLEQSATLGRKWQSSHLLFLSLAAKVFVVETPRPTEALAAFTERTARLVSWWQTAQLRFSALGAYEAATDMQNHSVSVEPGDFIYRLYRTKAALLLVRESAVAPEAVAMGMTLPKLGSALDVTDRLIRAVDTRDGMAAAPLRASYLRTMASLAAEARTALQANALDAEFRALASRAAAIHTQLAF